MIEQRVVCESGVHKVMQAIRTHFNEGWLVHTMVESTYASAAVIIIVFQRERDEDNRPTT